MKRLIQILAVSALGVLMIGCSKESSNEQISSTNYELKLRGDIKAPMSATRVNANGFEANDKVGVYVTSTGSLAAQGNTLDNAAYTYSNGNLNAPAGSEVYWDSKDARLSVYAYYPYAASIADNSAYAFAVEANQSEEENFYNSDFIAAKAENIAPQENAVSLTFTHSLSKVMVSLVAGEGISAEELAAAEKTFTISGLATNGTINIATGAATAGSTKAAITPLESNGSNYAAVVYPQEGAISFNLTLGGEVFSYTTNIDFEAGYQYQFNLTINTWESPEMTLKDTTISPWKDGGTTDGQMTNIITFSDSNFKDYIVSNYDTDNDGEISYAEAEAVDVIAVVGDMEISTLCDLKYFPNLTKLNCDYNQLTVLDVSQNPKLTQLVCCYNQLTELDITNNPLLTLLDCGANKLTSLDVSNNTMLYHLQFGQNQVTSIDVSHITELDGLYCGGNQLTSIDVSQNAKLRHLEIGENKLTELNISNNVKLNRLYCQYNQLTSLDVSNNTALTELECNPMNDTNGNNLLETIYIANGQVINKLDKPDATNIEEK
ncbi:MAG: fimbrillin family protein [Alistipes sp.]|nr:fimbrillin family protein [Alistipes sp.]